MRSTIWFACVLGLAVGAGGWTNCKPAFAGDSEKPAKLHAGELAKLIDKEIHARLAEENVPASPRADDAEFVRRIYLDITGVIPSADKAAEFIDSKDADKRAKLIDELLDSPTYGRHMADIWAGMIIPRDSINRRLQSDALTKWLADSFNENKPWNKFAHEVLTASGPQNENGATTFFLANATVDKMTDQVGKLFMGVQIQCAQCHNHPFTNWKQDDYWGMAAFFMKVRANANPQQAARNGTTLTITEEDNPRGRRRPNLPEGAKRLPPKFLGGEAPEIKAADPYRPVFADWLTTAENPFFSRAIVNRTWAKFFGRGLVNPIDDMHQGNKPSYPDLLDELSAQFAANGFDLKLLIRAITNSETYQRTSKPLAENEEDVMLFSHVAIKPLSPEQLFDSISAVVGELRPGGAGGRPARRPGGNTRAQFVAFFETDENADPADYQAGIPQALRLMNSPQLSNGATLLNEIARAKPAEAIERMYLATLSRRPTEKELERFTVHVTKVGERRGYSDVLWVLLNTSEFALNH